MKNIKIKIALIVALLASMPSMSAMGRFLVKGLHKPIVQKVSSLWGTKTRYTETLLAGLQEKAKNGILPSRKDLAEFDNSCQHNKYWILNSPDQAGHTLLNYVFKCAGSVERRTMMNLLKYRGAQFNVRDKFVMGPDAQLKANLNLPLEASAPRTIKALRTFFTKNTPKKLKDRESEFKISGNQAEERRNKVAEVKEAYAVVETDLLASGKKERLQKQINKQMPVY